MADPNVRDFIIFDCDGVLVDSEILAVEIEAELLNAAGFEITTGEIIDRFVGLSYSSMMATLADQFGRPMPAGLREQIETRTLDSFPDRLQPVDGIADYLLASPLPRCIASSSDLDRIQLSLEVTDLAGYFAPDAIFSAQMVDNGKPAPDLFLHAASSMGVTPEQCTVIEDSPHGVQAGVAAGMHVVGFTGGQHARPSLGQRLLDAGARSLVAHPSDLADLG